ncbi:GNAT family N-acetyltransferase [Actinosynnema sp. NPDC047251]|uniref:GNAT family N-acetyltransferase n=1 Tax=Saccharothrix espanaensis TaxID=103731 RepID=UPI0002FC8A1B|nr:GNAT family N-acetyltransferase [Saccharothrix espanaensis]
MIEPDLAELDLAELDVTDEVVARAVHWIGLRAYRVEAALIGSTAIPALSETWQEMRARPVRWLGAHVDGEVAGFVAWSRVDGVLDIDRLCVDPDHFRCGLGRALVSAVLAEGGPATVATGAANAPAIVLYEALGFRPTGTFEAVPGLLVAQFSRPGTP